MSHHGTPSLPLAPPRAPVKTGGLGSLRLFSDDESALGEPTRHLSLAPLPQLQERRRGDAAAAAAAARARALVQAVRDRARERDRGLQ